jgi:predicted transcriptional regulator
MKPNGVEKKLLDVLSEGLVMRRSELVDVLKSKKADVSGLDVIAKSLVQRGLITEVYASEKTYAITQKGMKGGG